MKKLQAGRQAGLPVLFLAKTMEYIGDVRRTNGRTYGQTTVPNQTLAYEMAEGNHELLLLIIEFFFIPLKIE